MFNPFIIEVILIFLKNRENKKEALQEACLHFPLVVPLVNTWRTYQLMKIKYSDPMSIRSLTEIEAIKMVAGNLILKEAFMVRSKPTHPVSYAY